MSEVTRSSVWALPSLNMNRFTEVHTGLSLSMWRTPRSPRLNFPCFGRVLMTCRFLKMTCRDILGGENQYFFRAAHRVPINMTTVNGTKFSAVNVSCASKCLRLLIGICLSGTHD